MHPNLRLASSFRDEEMARWAIAETLMASNDEIQAWLAAGEDPRLPLRQSLGTPIGTVVARHAPPLDASDAQVILRATTNVQGYEIVTAYPR